MKLCGIVGETALEYAGRDVVLSKLQQDGSLLGMLAISLKRI